MLTVIRPSFGLVVVTLMTALLTMPGFLDPQTLLRAERVVMTLAQRHAEPGRQLPEYQDVFKMVEVAIYHRHQKWEEAGWQAGVDAPAGLKTQILSAEQAHLLDQLGRETRSADHPRFWVDQSTDPSLDCCLQALVYVRL